MGQQKIINLFRSAHRGVLIDVKSILDGSAIPPHIAYWRL
jgi:hypothetical protein